MKINCAHTALVDVGEIIPNPDNPNVHPDNQVRMLAKILQYQGQRNAIVVSNRSGMVTKGHCRLMAIKFLKWEKAAVDFQDYESEEQEYADIEADNRIAELAYMDQKKSEMNMQQFLAPQFDIELLGMCYVEPVQPKIIPPEEEDDNAPSLPKQTKVRKGDVWLLGPHRLVCGNSALIDDVEKLMNGEKADVVWTDPPYNVASDSKNFWAENGNDTGSMSELKEAEWDKNFDPELPLRNLMLVTKESCTLYIWTSKYLIGKINELLAPTVDFLGHCIWYKPNPMPSLSKRHWTWCDELCVYATKGSKRVVNFPEQGHAYNIWTINKKSDGSHPTQKPVELCERAILFNSNESDLVLDLFGGSGTTLIACEKNSRRAFLMEISEYYCDVIIKRFVKYVGNSDKVFLLSGENKIPYKEIFQD